MGFDFTPKDRHFDYFPLSLQKMSCTRQFESKLSLRSFALALRHISVEPACRRRGDCIHS